VTLAAGSLLAMAYVGMPTGWTLGHLSSQVGGGKLRDRVLTCLADANATNALQANATLERLLVGTLVGLVPEAQCFLLHTKYSPSLTTGDEQNAYTDNASACQARCVVEPLCQHFTYWRASRMCSLHASFATAGFDNTTIAGPRVCAPLPSVGEPGEAADGRLEDGSGSGGNSILGTIWGWVWTILPLLLLLVLACICGLALRRTLLPRMLVRLAGLHHGSSENDDQACPAKVPPPPYQALAAEDRHLHSAGPHLAVRSREVCVTNARPRTGHSQQHLLGSNGDVGRPQWMPRFLGPEECVSWDADARGQAPLPPVQAQWLPPEASVAAPQAAPVMSASAPGHLWGASANPQASPWAWGSGPPVVTEGGFHPQAAVWGPGVGGLGPHATAPPALRLPPPTPCTDPDFTGLELLHVSQAGPLNLSPREQLDGRPPHIDVRGLPFT